MSDSFDFNMAQALREHHCDRKGEGHKCVGEVTIRAGEVCTSCTLCGSGEHWPGWDPQVAQKLEWILEEVGIRWSSLNVEKQVMVIQRYKAIHGESNGNG